MNNGWIPISSGKYPPSLKDVQVTYVLSSQSTDHKYYKCDVFAFLAPAEQSLDSIRWINTSTGKDLDLDIIAWRYNDDAYNPESKTASNKYNSTVRRYISDEYVRVSKELQSKKLQCSEIYEQLHDKSISHSDYLDKEKYLKVLQNDIRRLEVELNTWDAARELCLNATDEVGGK